MKATTSPKKKLPSSKPVAARRAATPTRKPGGRRQTAAEIAPSACPLRLSRLECETPLLPLLVAEGVCAEAARLLGDDGPMNEAPALAARARRLYRMNEKFATRLRERGNGGLEWLRAFMRHWLTARLRRTRPSLARRLPCAFAVGRRSL
jgi:hypothetical protein